MKIYLLSRGKEYEFDFSRNEYRGVVAFISYFNLKRFLKPEHRLSYLINSAIPQTNIDIAVDDKKSFQTLPEHKFLSSRTTENESDFYGLENKTWYDYKCDKYWHSETYNKYRGMITVANILLEQGAIYKRESERTKGETKYYDNSTKERFLTIIVSERF